MHFSVTHFIARRLRQAPQKAFTRIVYQIGIVSVALGLTTILIAFSVMEGFRQNITQKLTGFGGHLQVIKYSLNRTHEEPPIHQSKLRELQQAFPTMIHAAKAFAHKAMLLQKAEDLEGVVCKGLDPVATHENLAPYLTAGRLIDFSGQSYSHEVVLSKRTADRLQVQVGEEIMACIIQQQPRYRKLRVVGLYATHIEELDEQLVFCDLRLIQRLNNWPADWVGGYEVFLQNHDETQAAADQIRTWIDYDLGVRTTEREYAAIFDWLRIVQKNALIFMVLILLVMCSNLASIVLIQMMERTQMIGVLKTLGASNSQIQRTMLWNNLYMVGQGMLWGNLGGIGLFALQYYTHFITLDPVYYHIDHVPMAWSRHTMGGLNVLTLGVAFTTLLVAIGVIVRLRPVKALKT
ncbi:MAG: FtsX-like permease family protein [Bacteroidota bacterium]